MLDKMSSYTLEPIGFIRSRVKRREEAPRQGPEGAPDAWLEIEPQFAEALLGMEVGHELIVITWLHEARRDVLKDHPRSDESRPLTGVFYTRSPARPNPLGLHPVTVREVDGTRVKIGPIEDSTARRWSTSSQPRRGPRIPASHAAADLRNVVIVRQFLCEHRLTGSITTSMSRSTARS